ncbi:MAG: NADH-quinone oxidoreductase subunit NuoE [Acidimicrobiia bacterium]|nr:NADH-quinone oxidoreductase subunit NuoE [Acidimicrobiia bacterium]
MSHISTTSHRRWRRPRPRSTAPGCVFVLRPCQSARLVADLHNGIRHRTPRALTDEPVPLRIRPVDQGKEWSEETLERARAIIARYPQKKSAVMPLLFLAMAEDGRLTSTGMRQVADLVGITPAQVLSVASFYTMYKRDRTGKYLISACTSISCMLADGDEVFEAIETEAGVPHGETDEEGLISVEHVECIGACGGATAVQVNYELIEGVTPEKARELVRWLQQERPQTVNTDQMQEMFGGRRSFDWAIAEEDSAVGPFPAFPSLGTVGRNGERSQ